MQKQEAIESAIQFLEFQRDGFDDEASQAVYDSAIEALQGGNTSAALEILGTWLDIRVGDAGQNLDILTDQLESRYYAESAIEQAEGDVKFLSDLIHTLSV